MVDIIDMMRFAESVRIVNVVYGGMVKFPSDLILGAKNAQVRDFILDKLKKGLQSALDSKELSESEKVQVKEALANLDTRNIANSLINPDGFINDSTRGAGNKNIAEATAVLKTVRRKIEIIRDKLKKQNLEEQYRKSLEDSAAALKAIAEELEIAINYLHEHYEANILKALLALTMECEKQLLAQIKAKPVDDLAKLKGVDSIYVKFTCDGEEDGRNMEPDEHYSCDVGKSATIAYLSPQCSATNPDPTNHPDRRAIVTITKNKRTARSVASSAPAAKVVNETAYHVETEGFHEMFGGIGIKNNAW